MRCTDGRGDGGLCSCDSCSSAFLVFALLFHSHLPDLGCCGRRRGGYRALLSSVFTAADVVISLPAAQSLPFIGFTMFQTLGCSLMIAVYSVAFEGKFPVVWVDN